METCKVNTVLSGYKQADYSPENWQILLDIKTTGDVDIDNAACVADVMAALNSTAAAMAAVHTLLDDAKAAAHASLNAALAGYAEADYSPENWAILLEAMKAGDTDGAACVEDVTMALNNAEAAMAAVNTLLTDAKIAAHTSLQTELEVYAQDDYSPEAWAELNDFKTAGDAAIDEATDLSGVEEAQLAASLGMDGVQTIAETLTAAKLAAHEALTAALEAYAQSDYTEESWTELTGCRTAGDAAIDEAIDLVAIEEAQLAAELEMDEVPTFAEILTTAKLVAYDALTAVLEAYAQSDYTEEDWVVLNGCKSAGDIAVDEAIDLAGVEAAQSVAIAGMDGVQTIAEILAAAKAAAHDALTAAFEICAQTDTEEEAEADELEAAGEITAEEAVEVDATEDAAIEETAEVDAAEDAAAEKTAEVDAADGPAAEEAEEVAESEDLPEVEPADETETEAEDTDTDDALIQSQEELETDESIPDAAEAVAEDPESEVKSTPDKAN